jgi:hypothetical protein
MHIAGRTDDLRPAQRAWIERAAAVGARHLAPSAGEVDGQARYPAASVAALQAAGLMTLAVPAEEGGAGEGFDTIALVTAELARHCAATALCFALHSGALRWLAEAEASETPFGGSAAQATRARAVRRRVVDEGVVVAQAFSEGGSGGIGGVPCASRARAVDGGWRLRGRKIFVSMAAAADVLVVWCSPDVPGAGPNDTLMLAVPAGAPGVKVSGEWDALGLRGTDSRTVDFDEVFVPHDGLWLPPGVPALLAAQRPHLSLLFAPAFLGIAQAAFDFTVAWLRGEVPAGGAATVKRRTVPGKQAAVAQMRVLLEQARALLLQALREAAPPPIGAAARSAQDIDEARQRLQAAQFTVVEHAQAVAALALRTCGGQAMLRHHPLERLYRDARCGALMLPWTAELCLDQLGRDSLYERSEGDEVID